MSAFFTSENDAETLLDDEEFIKKQMFDDLQLAAELGNTLLERNKELEKTLRQQQNIIEDQAQEIEYLNKQTTALKEVNDSRLRIYEQLEVSIQDLERANHRLQIDSQNDKKHIKSLMCSIDALEQRCEDLQRSFEDVTHELDMQKRKETQQIAHLASAFSVGASSTSKNIPFSVGTSPSEDPTERTRDYGIDQTDSSCCHESKITKNSSCHNNDGTYNGEGGQPQSQKQTNCDSVLLSPSHTQYDANSSILSEEEIRQLVVDLHEERVNRTRGLQRVTELEEQMSSLVQENVSLRQKIVDLQAKEDIKSMHEELTTLEEVREGHLCARCLNRMERHRRNSSGNYGVDGDLYAVDDGIRSMESSILTDEPVKVGHGADEEPEPSAIKLTCQDSPDECNLSDDQMEETRSSPYREFERKYKELCMLQKQFKPNMRRRCKRRLQINNLSLLDELQGEDNETEKQATQTNAEKSEDMTVNEQDKDSKVRKTITRTPTDFSETSSGFSDEISNKSTQTEFSWPLFKLGDMIHKKLEHDKAGQKECGEEQAITSPVDACFKNYLQYRETFQEMLADLNKVRDQEPSVGKINYAHVLDEVSYSQSDYTDDNQSIISCATSDMSSTMGDFRTDGSLFEYSLEPPPTGSIEEENVPKEQDHESQQTTESNEEISSERSAETIKNPANNLTNTQEALNIEVAEAKRETQEKDTTTQESSSTEAAKEPKHIVNITNPIKKTTEPVKHKKLEPSPRNKTYKTRDSRPDPRPKIQNLGLNAFRSKSPRQKSPAPTSVPLSSEETVKMPAAKPSEMVLTPLKRDNLEYVWSMGGLRPRKKSKKQMRRDGRAESPVLLLGPKISYSSRLSGAQKRKDHRPLEMPSRALENNGQATSQKSHEESPTWNGNTLQFWSRSKLTSDLGTGQDGTSQDGEGTIGYRPSAASQELHKLFRLDLTYAEVLRNENISKMYKDHGAKVYGSSSSGKVRRRHTNSKDA